MSLECSRCGAPRQTTAVACPFCKALYGAEAPRGAPAASVEVPPGVAEALVRANFIEAMRLHREATGTSMQEAKVAVERIAGKMGPKEVRRLARTRRK